MFLCILAKEIPTEAMIHTIKRKFSSIFFTLHSKIIVLLFLSLIFVIENSLFANNPKPTENHFLSNSVFNSSIFSAELNIAYPYFPLVYTGFGVDHMNINLVNLSETGLLAGDEIGVFDGDNCVGSTVLTAKNILDNGVSIPSSANENTENKPNGYIDGHKITLKSYRSGIVYLLYFQTKNESKDIFERGGSMFALVDFSKSEQQTASPDVDEINAYPNPFSTILRIEINLSETKLLNCQIIDSSGRLIRTLFNEIVGGKQLLIWDGKDNLNSQVPSGIYLCRLNQSTIKIIYRR